MYIVMEAAHKCRFRDNFGKNFLVFIFIDYKLYIVITSSIFLS